MIFGIQIDDMDSLAVLTDVFLTGMAIVFSLPLTQRTLLDI